ncbi:putative peptidase S10, serine carboxypeptidase, alpha/Beta hydrolase [Helianthus annuus]|nr:putative peptidase S10, serine carboxypeptidase, alpha/Beta hydrolase [Helianthus annuus]
MFVSGDHDMNFPYVGTMEWISSLNLPIESPWAPWFVRNQVAGYRTIYTKNGYSLMHATVKVRDNTHLIDECLIIRLTIMSGTNF